MGVWEILVSVASRAPHHCVHISIVALYSAESKLQMLCLMMAHLSGTT
jgi:hypothetical protein